MLSHELSPGGKQRGCLTVWLITLQRKKMRRGDKAAVAGAHRGKLTSLHLTPTHGRCFLPYRGTLETSGWRIR